MAVAYIASGQNKRFAFYDALTLDSLSKSIEAKPDSSNLGKFLSILWQYTNLPGSIPVQNLRKKFKDNPFLTDEVDTKAHEYDSVLADKATKERRNLAPQVFKPVIAGPAAASNIGGALPWEANLIAGATEYLAEGFENTLTQYFLDALKDSLKQSKHFQFLFPSTYALVSVDGSQWAYGSMLQLLKTSIQSDLQNMPRNLNQFMHNVQPFRDELQTSTAIQLLSDILDIFDRLQSGQHPAEILDRLNELEVVRNCKDSTISGVMSVFAGISGALREKEGENHAWIPWSKIQVMRDKEKTYFFALIFQRIKDYPLSNYGGNQYTLSSAFKLLSEKKYSLVQLRGILEMLQGKFSQLSQAIENSKARADSLRRIGGAPFTIYLSYTDAALQIVEYALDQRLIDLCKLWQDPPPDVSRYRLIAFHTRQLLEQFQQQQYAASISHTLVILQLCNTHGKFPDRFFRDAAFLASIAEAKSAGDIKSALQAAALPVGSFAIKRKASFDVSVNSYIGLGLGMDFPNHSVRKFLGGLASPVGVTLSWGNLQGWIQACSAHINLLDFGIPLNASFADSGKIPTDLQLKHLLALGPGFICHIRNSPFSIGLLATYTPEVRAIAGVPGKQSTWRGMLLFSVDFPLFDIYANAE
jgi:hypothetical protein